MANNDEQLASAEVEADGDRLAKLYDVYLDERRNLAEREGSLDHAIATAVLTISGGALGVSLTVIDDSMLVAASSKLLGLGWILLVLALLCSLLSLKLNAETHRWFREILDRECSAQLEGGFERAQSHQRKSRLLWTLGIVDWVSVLLCLIGTLLLFVFVYLSLSAGGAPNAESSAPSTTTITTGTSATDNTEGAAHRSE